MQKTRLERHAIGLHLYQDRYERLFNPGIQINQIMPTKVSHNRFDESQCHICISPSIISSFTDWHLRHADHFAPPANEITDRCHHDSKPLKSLVLQAQPTPTRFCEISPYHRIKGETLQSNTVSCQHHHTILGVMHVFGYHWIF